MLDLLNLPTETEWRLFTKTKPTLQLKRSWNTIILSAVSLSLDPQSQACNYLPQT